VPAFSGVVVFAESILSVLFGSAYLQGATVLVILSAEKVVASIQSVLVTALRGIDEPRQAAWATTVTIVMNFSLNALLIPAYGIEGAAVATLVSVCVNTALHTYYLRRHVDIRFPTCLAGEITGTSALMGAVLLVLNSRLAVDTLAVLLPMIGLGIVVYGGCAVFVPDIRRKLIDPGTRVVLADIGFREDR
jgi:O-antigen/teichoic acid export membrane protein